MRLKNAIIWIILIIGFGSLAVFLGILFYVMIRLAFSFDDPGYRF